MARLAMPDGAVTGIEIEGARTAHITRYNGRIVDVDNPRHERALREMGAFPVNIGGRPRHASSWRCPDCGFAAFIKTCGRCGGTCTKE